MSLSILAQGPYDFPVEGTFVPLGEGAYHSRYVQWETDGDMRLTFSCVFHVPFYSRMGYMEMRGYFWLKLTSTLPSGLKPGGIGSAIAFGQTYAE